MDIKKSLQTLKTDITQKEATLKTLYKIYPHLIHLSEKDILTYFEVSTIDELRSHICTTIQYDNDPDHHNIQNISVCSCTDSHGKAKDLYDSEESAQKFNAHQNIKLKVYRCPNGCGWHLTKG